MPEMYHASDFHFGHDNEVIYKARGFHSAGEMDAAVMDSLYSVLRKGDTLINYGDNAIEGTWQHGLEQMRAIKSIGVTLELRIGNHDKIWPDKRDAARFFREYADVFDNIQLFTRAKQDGINYIQSHTPYWPNDRHTARMQQWRPADLGLPIVHGHTHSTEAHDWERHMHVGWDAWRRPVTHGEILDWLRTVK